MKNNKAEKPIAWMVYVEDVNAREIRPYNVYGSSRVKEFLEKTLKNYSKALGDYEAEGHTDLEKVIFKEQYKINIFKEELLKEMRYLFWAQAEWEIILTSWPPFVTKEEVERMSAVIFETHYRATVELDVEEKVSVYDQLQLNWDAFADYTWDNLRHIVYNA